MNILSCLKGFIATVDCKSFSKAAQKLYTSPSKLSKQITWLEEELKVTLLVRSTTRLIVTESGHRLYEKALLLLEKLDEIKVFATPDQSEVKGGIKLYLTVTPAIPYLTSLSIEFMRQYPNIEIDIIVGSDTKELYSSTFDLAISFDDVNHSKLVCKKLFSIQRKVFASPGYIAQHGLPQTIDDLSKHNCLINSLYGLQNKWVFNKKIIHVFGNFKSNNAGVLKQAAVADIGLLWAPYFSVYEEIRNETLIQVLPHESSPDINLYAISPKYAVDEQKVNLLLNFFCEKAYSETIAASFIDENK
ncbi:LysR substrate-binding domain-containing protein [Fluoribacter dumoffii]|uniref:D-malate degradation protein R n=1 Tax=Fluoribacter dumoffii TaxID=463 RepID=A0A377GC55_9GAMM|nr:LysR family transcriptional regulator [Fluoribacter dumoffii]KTC90549.1 LysR family transporter transcriptional regulator [Fluoribacter dumoffii NY 23]MCW8386229.1 LysR substrate-binding domain-containing protein [Fluoribacter dumoffii]MCW8419280.1 LysR substrate-binding domain-containing protein [Fluoribacter dumoffii]MCW8452845.1 LysR substrate-binding domain-containing protein [Fluoribacter dumoffii]MCW8459905.1 LysR substrate-binding domain-containing protein [Fluoribacter dumoffii]